MKYKSSATQSGSDAEVPVLVIEHDSHTIFLQHEYLKERILLW